MPFAKELRVNQIRWATESGKADYLEDKPNWVLRGDNKGQNLYEPQWLHFIKGREHRWFRALNSSQAFAVNLFGPLADSPRLAREVFERIVPGRALHSDDEVRAHLEYTPPEGPRWLRERKTRQPTQTDMTFEVRRGGTAVGFLLVEVKLSENFVGCRGFKVQYKERAESSPCFNAAAVLANPQTECWMVSHEGRRYWEIMKARSSFELSSLTATMACPFRAGLYQLMRNKVLAESLLQHGGAQWADLAVCVHPRNELGTVEVDEFRSLVGEAVS
jgi:hypothetical protein